MRKHASTIFLAATIAVCLGWLIHYNMGSKVSARRTVASAPVLKPGLSGERLERATQYFCAVKYHRESCINYLIKCGERCFGFLTDENKVRIFADYQDLRVRSRLKRLPESWQ